MPGLTDELTKPDVTASSVDINHIETSKNESFKEASEIKPVIAEVQETSQLVKTDNGANHTTDKKDSLEEATEIQETSLDKKIQHDVNGDTSKSDSKENKPSVVKPNPTYPDGVLKTTAQIDGVNNSKYDPSVLPTTDDPNKIRAQVEFYFGDANLPTDKYLWSLTQGSSNLPVPIKKICEFGRMRRFNPYSAVVSALKESKFLEVSGEVGEEEVKRKVAFDLKAPRSKAESRSIYAKGFGDEEPSSQFDIEAFFAQHGPTNAVRLRRTPEKLFKGSVFVEFADEETAQKFLDLPNKPLWKGLHVLKIMSKKAYVDSKLEEIKSGKIEPTSRANWSRGRGKGRDRGNFRSGNRDNKENFRGRKGDDRDPNDWKKRRDEDRASGFKDDRNRNRGRQGRGRGKGRDENRRGRSDKGNNNDGNQESETKKEVITPEDKNVKSEESHNNDQSKEASTKLESQSSKIDSASNIAAENTTKSPRKRAREDDDDVGQGASKKISTKTEAPEL